MERASKNITEKKTDDDKNSQREGCGKSQTMVKRQKPEEKGS